MRGSLASQGHGKAGKEVGVAGEQLWRQIGDEQSSLEKNKGAAVVYAGEEARPGLFIAQRRGDKQEKRPGNKFGRKKSEIGDGGAFPWAADEVACRGALRAAWRRASRQAKGGSGAAELHARRVEVERLFGEAVPAALELAGVAKQGRRGGEAPARRGAYAWGQQRRRSRAGVPMGDAWGGAGQPAGGNNGSGEVGG